MFDLGTRSHTCTHTHTHTIIEHSESTGLRNQDLIWGTKYYVEKYFGTKNNDIRVGATVGNSVPAPNSELEDFDFWMVEAYNLFGAIFIEKDRCERFVVDSLPETRFGLCGRECE